MSLFHDTLMPFAEKREIIMEKIKRTLITTGVLFIAAALISGCNGEISKTNETTETAASEVKDVSQQKYNNPKTVKSYDGENLPTFLKTLDTDDNWQIAGKTGKVTFSVSGNSIKSSVYLYDSNNKKIKRMNDNGKDGDKKAGDNRYSCTISVKRKSNGTETYYAKTDDVISRTAEVRFFKTKLKGSAKGDRKIQKKIKKIDAKYSDANGLMFGESGRYAIADVAKYAKKLKKSHKIVYYEKTSLSVRLLSPTGKIISYNPNIVETLNN